MASTPARRLLLAAVAAAVLPLTLAAQKPTADPLARARQRYNEQKHDAALQAMRTFPQRRAAFIDSWLAEPGHCPPGWPEAPAFQPNRSYGP